MVIYLKVNWGMEGGKLGRLNLARGPGCRATSGKACGQHKGHWTM